MPKLMTTAALLAVLLSTALPAVALGQMHGQAQVPAAGLPFSGLDAVFVLGAGLLLVLLGLGLGQVSTTRSAFRLARNPARGAVAVRAAIARR